VHVVEVSSFQLETTDTFHPWVSVLLNLSADHLDRHGTFENYVAAKARIFANQTASDWAVINADDPAAMALAGGYRARRLDFAIDTSLSEGITLEAGSIVRRQAGESAPLVPLSSVRLPGKHLLGDVLAATRSAASRARAAGRNAASRRGIHRSSARPRARGRDRRCHIHQRLEGDEHRVGQARAREFPTASSRSGGRYKGGEFGDLAAWFEIVSAIVVDRRGSAAHRARWRT
jgi:hypothetical protein